MRKGDVVVVKITRVIDCDTTYVMDKWREGSRSSLCHRRAREKPIIR